MLWLNSKVYSPQAAVSCLVTNFNFWIFSLFAKAQSLQRKQRHPPKNITLRKWWNWMTLFLEEMYKNSWCKFVIDALCAYMGRNPSKTPKSTEIHRSQNSSKSTDMKQSSIETNNHKIYTEGHRLEICYNMSTLMLSSVFKTQLL